MEPGTAIPDDVGARLGGRARRFGRYVLGRVLGEGGAGRIHAAVLVGPGGLRKDVALKVLHDGGDALQREARLGGLLRHRHLVDVYEVGEVDGQWFCAMELCVGSLDAHLPLSPRAVVDVGLQVCEALAYAHDALGLVHLDIKPANLLVGHDGAVKLADLGIARAAGFHDDRMIRGTPGYMAPEQARGAPLDRRADLYALGVTLLQLAGGGVPEASATMDWLSDETTEPALPGTDSDTLDLFGGEPIAPAGAIPPWLEPAVAPCLEDDPADRWPDADALARALRDLDPPGEPLSVLLQGVVPVVQAPSRPRREPVGRVALLHTLGDALRTPGILALRGPPGIGKSLLAAAAVHRWGGQAWQIDLAGAASADDVWVAVASALDVPLLGTDRDAWTRRIGDALAARGAAALVVDNADHVAGSLGVLEAWARRAPQARLVVTARAALDLAAVRAVAVGPMDEADAVALVVDRARERGVALEDGPDVRALVARLDGVPLALELAAGRLGVLSVSEVLERLELSLLRRGDDGRRGALQAALDASWELLTAAERATLAQLSVFAGPFGVPVAEEVVVLGEGAVLDALDALVERSMVQPRPDASFALLSSVREYARGQLADPAGAELRHGQAHARLGGREALVAVRVHGGLAARAALERAQDDLVAACRRAVARGDGVVAVPTLRAVAAVLCVRGPLAALWDLAAHVETCPGLTPPQLGTVHRILGDTAYSLGDSRVSLDHHERAIEAMKAAGDLVGVARLRSAVARTRRRLGEVDGVREAMLEAIDTLRELGDEGGVAHCQAHLGELALSTGHHDEALACFEASLAVRKAHGDLVSEGVLLGSLGAVHAIQGRHDLARWHLEQALARSREVGDRYREGVNLGNLGLVHRTMGQLDRARALFEETVELHRESGNRPSEAHWLCNLAILDRDQGRPTAEARFREALALAREIGVRSVEATALADLGVMHMEEGDLTAAGTYLDQALAAHRSTGNRTGEGIALGNLGSLARKLGDRELARSRYVEALALARVHGPRAAEAHWAALLGRVTLELGELETASAHLDEAGVLADDLGSPGARAMVRLLRGELALARGDAAGARAALVAGRALAPPGHRDCADAAAALEAHLAG